MLVVNIVVLNLCDGVDRKKQPINIFRERLRDYPITKTYSFHLEQSIFPTVLKWSEKTWLAVWITYTEILMGMKGWEILTRDLSDSSVFKFLCVNSTRTSLTILACVLLKRGIKARIHFNRWSNTSPEFNTRVLFSNGSFKIFRISSTIWTQNDTKAF